MITKIQKALTICVLIAAAHPAAAMRKVIGGQGPATEPAPSRPATEQPRQSGIRKVLGGQGSMTEPVPPRVATLSQDPEWVKARQKMEFDLNRMDATEAHQAIAFLKGLKGKYTSRQDQAELDTYIGRWNSLLTTPASGAPKRTQNLKPIYKDIYNLIKEIRAKAKQYYAGADMFDDEEYADYVNIFETGKNL